MDIRKIRNELQSLKKQIVDLEKWISKTNEVIYEMDEKLMDIEDQQIIEFKCSSGYLSQLEWYRKYVQGY